MAKEYSPYKMKGHTLPGIKQSPAKQAKQKGLGPRTAFGGVKNPELVKTKKTKGKKVMIDGPKKQVTGVKNPGNWQPHPDTFKNPKKAKKSPAKQTQTTTQTYHNTSKSPNKSVQFIPMALSALSSMKKNKEE